MFRPIYFSAIPSSASAAQLSYDGPQAGPSTEIQRSLPSGQELAVGQAQHSLHQGGLFENPNVSQPIYSASAFSMMAMQPTARQRKHQASQQNNYQAITRQHIQQWIDMSHIESVPITRDNFARQHLLNPLDFKNYVTVKGRLKLRGRVLLTKEKNARYREIEYKDIQAWQALSQEERDHLTREGFAAKHQLSPQSFANYVSTEGQLNTRGLILCNKYQGKQYQSVNLSHVQAWYCSGLI